MKDERFITINIIEQLKNAIGFYEERAELTIDPEAAAFFKGKGIAFREMKQFHEDVLVLIEARMR